MWVNFRALKSNLRMFVLPLLILLRWAALISLRADVHPSGCRRWGRPWPGMRCWPWRPEPPSPERKPPPRGRWRCSQHLYPLPSCGKGCVERTRLPNNAVRPHVLHIHIRFIIQTWRPGWHCCQLAWWRSCSASCPLRRPQGPADTDRQCLSSTSCLSARAAVEPCGSTENRISGLHNWSPPLHANA